MVFTRNQKRKIEDLEEEIYKIIFSKKKREDDSETETNYSEDIDDTESKVSEENSEENVDIRINKNDKKYGIIKSLKGIYSGEYFHSVKADETTNILKQQYSDEQLEQFQKTLDSLQNDFKFQIPNIIDLLNMDIIPTKKWAILEKVYILANAPVLSPEYTKGVRQIKELLTETKNEEEKKIISILKTDEYTDDYKQKILKLDTTLNNKVIAYQKLSSMEQFADNETSEYAKYKNWLDTLLSMPFGKELKIPEFSSPTEVVNYLENVRTILDKRLSFLEKPKDQIINVITQMMRGVNSGINAIGLGGPKGLGKCLAKDTDILMYDGSIKKVQNVVKGDILMGDDSTPRNVLSSVSGTETMYKITHADTGECYTVNESHILSLKFCYKNKIHDCYKKKFFKLNWYNVNSKKIYSSIFDYNDDNKEIVRKNVQNLLNKINKENVQDEIIDINVVEYLNMKNKHLWSGYKNRINFPTSNINERIDFINKYLKNFNGNFFTVPCNEVDTVKTHYHSFSYIVNSLGYSCVKYKNHYRVYPKSMSKLIIEKLSYGDYYGFEIDGNHRFVLGNFIVTHNTSIVKSIAEALNRPYRTISLGGESDVSSLVGHGFTYIGSNPGRIIDILRETNCMNPIILIDELDKVSQTHQGKELIGALIHMTDHTTNSKYNYDRYFSGIEFDLSKVLFIFTYNDESKVDKILADRLFKIKIDNYSLSEKSIITEKHIIQSILQEYSFNNNEIEFPKECIDYILHLSKEDVGMREIKRKFEIIISRINTLVLTTSSNNIIKLKYASLKNYYTQFPCKVLKEHIPILLEDSITNETTSDVPFGMYL